MTVKPGLWFSIAVVLGLINLAGAGYAVGAAEPKHAALHVVLTAVCGVWAQRLWRGRGGTQREVRVDALEAEIRDLRLELSETQERLDFAERMLTKSRERTRVER